MLYNKANFKISKKLINKVLYMNNYNEQYRKWYKYSDNSTKDELSKMTDEQIYDSFYKEL